MKVRELFETSQSVASSKLYEPVEYWDYIFSDLMLCEHKHIEPLKKNKFKGVDYFHSLPPRDQKQFLVSNKPWIDELKFSGNKLTCIYFTISNYDLLGDPPFKLGRVHAFEINNKNAPFKTLDILPEYANNIFISNCSGLASLHGIHNHLKECQYLRLDHLSTLDSYLGLLKIKGLDELRLDWTQQIIDAHQQGIFHRIVTLLNNYIPNTRGNAGILDCQNALIDLGFEDMAQL